MDKFKQLIRSAGSRLRAAWWRHRLASLGNVADLQPGVCFEFAGNIFLGEGCRIARQAVIRANTKERPGIELGDEVHVQENVLINANRGYVTVGSGSWIGPGSVIYGNGGIEIGSDVMIASHCTINTVSHYATRTDIPMKNQGIYCDPVCIEDDVWIGAGVTILQGVRIGRGSIIGAGALVTRDVPDYSVALGVPARVTANRRDQEEQHLEKFIEGGLQYRRNQACQ
jgi:acetyltransferase-like isoleucine patch superfamily enzyme